MWTRRASVCSERCERKRDHARYDERKGRFQPSPVQRRRVYERDEFVCHLCDQPVRRDVPDDHPWSASLDHIVTRSQGGSNTDDNLATAHRWCNVLRRDGSILREPGRFIPETWEDFAAAVAGQVLAPPKRGRRRKPQPPQYALF
jgi:5-methylcytosine-specific restriction endonuclease McrA